MQEQLLKFLKRHIPKTYNKLKKIKFLNDCFDYERLFFFILKRKKSFLRFFLKTTFSYYALGNKSDITFKFEGNEITMPRHLRGIDGFIEVWSDGFYDKIRGYNHVLDLGGYIGDSALKFSKNNKKVTVYEAHPCNFKYLKKNTEILENVKIYNKAVIGDKQIKNLKFYGGSFNMSAGTGNFQDIEKNYVMVPAISIIDILGDSNYDAIKMDIEGAEYDCFDVIMKDESCKFNFLRGFVEFHLFKNKKNNLLKIEGIIEWFVNKNYKLEYYDVISNEYFKGLGDLTHDVFLVYFDKIL